MNRCVGKACSDGPLLDDAPGPRWAVTGTMLCRRCTHTLEQHLTELPARRDRLHAILAGGGGRGTMRRGTPELPVPLNLSAHDHISHLIAVAISWTQLVREERNLHGPDSDDPSALAPWLLSQLDWIIQQPWVDDMAEELRDASAVADGLTGHRPLRNRLEPPCPHCKARELGRWDGAAQVDCASCGSVWDEKFYPALVRLVLDDSRGCMTAAEAAEQLGVTAGALRQLVSRGKVRKLGTVDGMARYSASDVEGIKTSRESA